MVRDKNVDVSLCVCEEPVRDIRICLALWFTPYQPLQWLMSQFNSITLWIIPQIRGQQVQIQQEVVCILIMVYILTESSGFFFVFNILWSNYQILHQGNFMNRCHSCPVSFIYTLGRSLGRSSCCSVNGQSITLMVSEWSRAKEEPLVTHTHT